MCASPSTTFALARRAVPTRSRISPSRAFTAIGRSPIAPAASIPRPVPRSRCSILGQGSGQITSDGRRTDWVRLFRGGVVGGAAPWKGSLTASRRPRLRGVVWRRVERHRALDGGARMRTAKRSARNGGTVERRRHGATATSSSFRTARSVARIADGRPLDGRGGDQGSRLAHSPRCPTVERPVALDAPPDDPAKAGSPRSGQAPPSRGQRLRRRRHERAAPGPTSDRRGVTRRSRDRHGPSIESRAGDSRAGGRSRRRATSTAGRSCRGMRCA